MRRRILHLRTVCGRGGGPEKTLLNSPRFLADAYDVRLAYIRPECDAEYDMPERAAQMGVDLVDIPEAGPADIRTVRRLSREIREFAPHVLHAHDYKTNGLALVLGKWFGVPAITTVHGWVERTRRTPLYYALDRFFLRRLRLVICVSSDLHDQCVKLGVPTGRCVLVENGIDSEAFRRRTPIDAAKRKLGLPPNRRVVGAVGRLSPEKGFDSLIRAIEALVRNGSDVSLVIAGEGNQKSELQQLAAACGLKDRVHLVGFQADTRPIYEAMDVFALSSLREGLPNVLLEAMAIGVPVVSTRVADVPRVVTDESDGLLVEPDDLAGLTDSLDRLLKDESLRSRLGDAGRATVEQRFSFARRMQRIRELYDSLLNGSPHSGQPRPSRFRAANNTNPKRQRGPEPPTPR